MKTRTRAIVVAITCVIPCALLVVCQFVYKEVHDQDGITPVLASRASGHASVRRTQLTESLKSIFSREKRDVPFWLLHCAENVDIVDREVMFNPPTLYNSESRATEFSEAAARKSYGNQVKLEAQRDERLGPIWDGPLTVRKLASTVIGRGQYYFRSAMLSNRIEAYIIYDEVPSNCYFVVIDTLPPGLGGGSPLIFVERITNTSRPNFTKAYGPGQFAFYDIMWDEKSRHVLVFGCNREVLFCRTYYIAADYDVALVTSVSSSKLE